MADQRLGGLTELDSGGQCGEDAGEGTMMQRFLKDLGDRWKASREIRRRRALYKAIAEKELRESEEATIWKSGRGGGHPDH